MNAVDFLRAWRGSSGTSEAGLVARLLPGDLYMSLIFMASSVQGPDVPQVVDDRISHFVVYFGLGALTMFSAAGFSSSELTLRHTVASFMVALAFAASDDWHQSFVAGRDSSLNDLLFDALGAGAAVSLIWLMTGGRR